MSSKKIRTVLIAMLVLLGLAGGGYALVDHIKQQEEQAAIEEAASLKLFSFDVNAVDTVEITNADGYFRIGQEDGAWTLAETDFPHTFVLNDYYINVITSTMSGLTALQKISADPAQLGSYGLEDPVTITCHAGGEQYTLCIGTGSVTKEYYYVSVPGDDTVYCISYDSGSGLRGGIGYLRSSYMVHYYETDITDFSLERFGETAYDLSVDDAGQWQFNAPYANVDVDTVKVNSILTDLVRTEFETLETFTDDPAELAAYGLDKPAYRFTLRTADSETVLEFADFDPNDAVLYVYEPENGAVSSLAMRNNAFLTGNWYDLLNEKVLRVPFADASALDVTVDGMQFHMTMDHESGTYMLDDIEASAVSDEVGSVFEYLYASVSEIGFESVIENPVLPEDPQPACQFVYTLTEGTERTLALVPIDDTSYLAYVDGRCIGQTVRRNALSGTSGVLNFLEKMVDALADEGVDYAPAAAESIEEETAESETSPEPSA